MKDREVMDDMRMGKRFTYADYYKWDDGKRWELINGEAYLMEPAPLWGHQDIQTGIMRQICYFLEGKQGKVFAAPFDVRLNADAGDDNVVQPDIVIFCDRSKLSGTGCIGAPDMVVEILSPSTAKRDQVLKLNLYLAAGVREYWIVDPESKRVQVCILKNNEYIVKAYCETDKVPVHIFEGCVINLAEVFDD